MAMIDYGALLRVNGKFINKNQDLFMDMQESVGFILEKAMYPEYDNKMININHDFYVYAGSKKLLLCFYKTFFYVIKDNTIIKHYYGSNLNSETIFINDVKIKIEHLDKNWIIKKQEISTWEEERHYMSKKQYDRYKKRIISMNKRNPFRYKTNRYIATWEYEGNKYEVIFGYGIDPDEEVWNDIKFDGYGFTENEREIINKWFE